MKPTRNPFLHLAFLALTLPAAAQLTWDPAMDGSTSGGAGTWDTTTTNWWNGAADVTWNNSGADEAIISNTGADYVINAPAVVSIPNGKVQMVRIVATEPDTTLTYDPPQNGGPTMLANAGDVITINATSQDFRISSAEKILVSEYMQGQNAGGNKGDPAMTLAVPVEQYRTNYLIHAPTNYSDSFANIIAPTQPGDVR